MLRRLFRTAAPVASAHALLRTQPSIRAMVRSQLYLFLQEKEAPRLIFALGCVCVS